jgi:hypothetical protein
MSGHLIAKHVELMKIVERIAKAYHANWPDSLRHAILDAEDFIKPAPKEEFLTEAEENEALSYMDQS